MNPRPGAVSDEQFASSEFLDARDLVQVKYEMVRRVRVDGDPVTRAAQEFGFSRPSFYEAAAALDAGGLAGLVPARPGPRGAHKLTDEVLAFAWERLAGDPALRAGDLVGPISSGSGCASIAGLLSGHSHASAARDRREIDDRAAADDDVDRYEQLRDRALAGTPGGSGLGLAMLQDRGVTAWTRAWHTTAPPAANGRASRAVPVGEQEIVSVLASMALACATAP